MAGDLDQQYAETQGNLQDAINEALIQLGNARSQVNSLTGLAQNLTLPSAPGAADVEFPSNASGTLLAQIESF